MALQHCVCVNEKPHATHKASCVIFFNKNTDYVLGAQVGIDLINTPVNSDEPITKVLTETELAQEKNNMAIKNNLSINDIGHVVVCDNGTGFFFINKWYIKNGLPAKKYIAELTHNAVDHDGDGLPDIEGDGASTIDCNLKILDPDTGGLVTDFNGLLRVKPTRGKVLGGMSGMIDIINGQCSFSIRSVDETIREVFIKCGIVLSDQVHTDQRVMWPEPITMNYR